MSDAIGPLDNVLEELFSGTAKKCVGCFMTPGPDVGMSVTLCYRSGQPRVSLMILCPDCHKLRFQGARGVEISRRQAYAVTQMFERNARVLGNL